ncbi:MAG: hypothetical protein ACTHLH_11300 [Solirubrobacterales bacterium]
MASISASVKSIANKALKKAKAAQKTANSALNAANSAQSTANSANTAAANASKEAKAAQTTANTAQTAAKNAQTTADAAKSAAAAAQGTANEAKTLAASKLGTTEFVGGPTSETNTTAFKLASASCPEGSVATGGGFEVGPTSAAASQVTVSTQNSAIYGPGWLVTANAISGMTPNWNLKSIAVCAHP